MSDRPQRARPSRPRAAAPPSGTSTSTWAIGATFVAGVVGAACFWAYRTYATPKAGKKERSSSGKKDKKSKKPKVSEEPQERTSLKNSGRTSPPPAINTLHDSRPNNPTSTEAQLAFYAEIAKDQLEAGQKGQAEYYAKKAIQSAEANPANKIAFMATLTYCQMRYIVIHAKGEKEGKMEALKELVSKLDVLKTTQDGKTQDYRTCRVRVLSSLAELFTRSGQWIEAEPICEEIVGMTKDTSDLSAEQQLAEMKNHCVQCYQLALVKRNLKKYEKALEYANESYELGVKTDFNPAFTSAVARQVCDILEHLGKYEDAKRNMLDHIEALLAKKANQDKKEINKEEDSENDEISSQKGNPHQISPTLIGDNYLFLARLLFDHEDFDGAIELMMEALEQARTIYYLSMLANIQFASGKNDEALKTQAEIKQIHKEKGSSMAPLPIASSKYVYTKMHYVRPSKDSRKWTFFIQLDLKPETIHGEALRLKPGNLIECYVRRHYDPEETIIEKNSMGPFYHVFKGEEKDKTLTIKGILPKTLEKNAVYEIVLNFYASQAEKTKKLSIHRQMSIASSFDPAQLRMGSLSSSSSSQILSDPLEDENLDDFLLPEPTGVNQVGEEDETKQIEIEEYIAESSSSQSNHIVSDHPAIAAEPSVHESSSNGDEKDVEKEKIVEQAEQAVADLVATSEATRAFNEIVSEEEALIKPTVAVPVVEETIVVPIVVPVVEETIVVAPVVEETIVVGPVVEETIVVPVVVPIVEEVVAPVVEETVVVPVSVTVPATAVVEEAVAEAISTVEEVIETAVEEAVEEALVAVAEEIAPLVDVQDELVENVSENEQN